jgi:hypothetical protein
VSAGSERVSNRRVTEAKPKSIYKTSSSAPRSPIVATGEVSQKQTTLSYLSAVALRARGVGGNAGFDYWRNDCRERKDHKTLFEKMIVMLCQKRGLTPDDPR